MKAIPGKNSIIRQSVRRMGDPIMVGLGFWIVSGAAYAQSDDTAKKTPDPSTKAAQQAEQKKAARAALVKAHEEVELLDRFGGYVQVVTPGKNAPHATATPPASSVAPASAMAPASSAMGHAASPAISTAVEPEDIGLADTRLRANLQIAPITIQDAIFLALENNPQRAAAMAAVRQAVANIKVAKSQGGLQSNLDGSAIRERNTPSQTVPGTAQAQDLSIDSTLLLYSGGRVSAAVREAQFNAQAQIAQEKQVEQDLIFNTTVAYLNVLRSQELLDVADANLAVSRERLRVADIRFSVGASARLDVLQARTDLADARQLRIQAANNLGQADANLDTSLGRAPDAPVRVEMITTLGLPPAVSIALNPSAAATAPAIPSTTSTSQAPTSAGAGAGPTSTTPNVPTTSVPPATPGAPPLGGPSSATASGSAPAGGSGAGGYNAGSTSSPVGTTTPGLSVPGMGATSAPSAVSGPGASTGGTGTTGSAAGGAAGTAGSAPAGATGSAIAASATGGTTATSGTAIAANSTGVTSSTGAAVAASAASISGGATGGLASMAGSTRESLAVTLAELQASQAALDLARAQRHPSLGLSFSAILRNPASVLGHFATSIGLGLGQTLFDSGAISGQIEAARALVDENTQILSGQKLDVANAIETAILALDSAQRRLRDADTGVLSAREALRITQLGFRSGVNTTLDIASTQAALLTAATDAVNARFDVANAQAQLADTVGVFTIEAQTAYQRMQRDEAAHQQQVDQQSQASKKKKHKFLGIF